VAQILETQNEMLKAQNEMLKAQNEMRAEIVALTKTQNEMRDTQMEMLKTQSEILTTQSGIIKTQGEILRRLDNVEAGFQRIGNDFRNFRGRYASDAVEKHPVDVVFDFSEGRDLGLDEATIKALSPPEIIELLRNYGSERLAAIPKGVRRSFYRADLIIRVQKEDSSYCYLAVEGSYTCGERDTERAMSNARLLTEFTGEEAWPVVAGVRIDNRIRHLIDSGEVFWFRVEEEEMEPIQAN
ncbi:MAG: hypothetical protein OXC95_17750, partial [Dehalococcoidia bacterium]|nr:hypothetical protein [Dehalococcoidia bacterium]